METGTPERPTETRRGKTTSTTAASKKMATLSETEQKRLAEVENEIERGNITLMQSFAEIRAKKLYRDCTAERTFEAYCEERWGYTRTRGNQLADAGIVLQRLETIRAEMSTKVDILGKLKESWLRPLVGKPAPMLKRALQKLGEEAEAGKKTTAKSVQNAVGNKPQKSAQSTQSLSEFQEQRNSRMIVTPQDIPAMAPEDAQDAKEERLKQADVFADKCRVAALAYCRCMGYENAAEGDSQSAAEFARQIYNDCLSAVRNKEEKREKMFQSQETQEVPKRAPRRSSKK